ncbi:hypothetical protein DRO61_04785 [Candidatus Bathyarchaeota archaeon]|nr:MAG: hypothetical protein DRO61_04785 [Candidatus Bathyarchaeota archaeon]
MKKEIPGYPGYKITTRGRVVGKRGEFLSLELRPDKYYGVKLYKKGSQKAREREACLVHRLVMLAFGSEDEVKRMNEGCIVNHKNGDRSDNRFENLDVLTHKGNTEHAWENNLIAKWERKVKQFSLDGKLLAEYDSITEASKASGVSVSGISRVCRGNGKTSGGYKWEFNDDKDKKIPKDVDKWKRIENFEDYRISPNGIVYSEKRKKVIAQQKKGAYYTAKLLKGGKASCKRINILVAKAYIPNPDNLPEVNHLNGNPIDNRVENLEWSTKRGNSQHACDTGLCPRPKGKAVIQYDDDWNEIARFTHIQDAHKASGAHPDTITLVCNGKRNKSGGYKWKWQ